MVAHRNSVVTEDVDLVLHLAAAANYVLGLYDHIHPSLLHGLVEVLLDFRVLEVLRI